MRDICTTTGTGARAARVGPRYWQNAVSYTLTAKLLEAQKRLEGTGRIVYYNRSPVALESLQLDLTQNFHAPGAIRFEEAEITGGVRIARVAINGTTLVQTTSPVVRVEIDREQAFPDVDRRNNVWARS